MRADSPAVASREISATRPRAAGAPQPATAGRRAVARRMPSETTVGFGLLALGILVAILILTGAVQIGFAR